MTRRSRLEIYYLILKRIRREPVIVSRLTQETNLSWLMVKQVLKCLLEKNMIMLNSPLNKRANQVAKSYNRPFFTISIEGIDVIKMIKTIYDRLGLALEDPL